MSTAANNSTIVNVQNLEIRLGRPNPKLVFQFSQIHRKWNAIEPYNVGGERKQSDASARSSQKMIITSEDQIKLKLIEEQKQVINQQIMEGQDKSARLQCQVNMMKLHLINIMEQLEQKLKQAQGLESGSRELVIMDDEKVVNPQVIDMKSDRQSEASRKSKKSNQEEEKEAQRI